MIKNIRSALPTEEPSQNQKKQKKNTSHSHRRVLSTNDNNLLSSLKTPNNYLTKLNLQPKSPKLKQLFSNIEYQSKLKNTVGGYITTTNNKKNKFDDFLRRSNYDFRGKNLITESTRTIEKTFKSFNKESLDTNLKVSNASFNSSSIFTPNIKETLEVLKSYDPRKQAKELEKFLEGQNLQKHTLRYIEFIVNSLSQRIEEIQSHFTAFLERNKFQVKELKFQIKELEETNSKLLKHFLKKENETNERLFELMCQCEKYSQEKESLEEKIKEIEKKNNNISKKNVYNLTINNNNNGGDNKRNKGNQGETGCNFGIIRDLGKKKEKDKIESKGNVYAIFSSSKESSNTSFNSHFDVKNYILFLTFF